MSYGPCPVFTGSIASGATTCTSINLGGKAYSRVFVELGTMSTNSIVSVYGSSDGSDFKPVFERVPNTTSVQWQAIQLTTAVVGGIAPVNDLSGIAYAQFRATAVISGGCTIKVICVD